MVIAMNDGATTRAVVKIEAQDDDHDDDDHDRKPPAVSVSTPGGGRTTKRRRLVLETSNGEPSARRSLLDDDDDDDDDDEDEEEDGVLEVTQQVAPPPAAASVSTSSSSNNNNNNNSSSSEEAEEVQLLSTTLPDVFAEFPHAREHCRVHPFKRDPTAHCPNCYCYVCDFVASDCARWHPQPGQPQELSHCHAVSTSPAWRQQRQQRQQQQQQRHHHQQQQQHHHHHYSRSWHSFSVQELLAAVTRVYPRETSPAIPQLFRTELMHYQKQALAFMVDVERNFTVKSGWLASEVGMGKTAVVIALIVSNPMPLAQQPTAEQCKDVRFHRGLVLDVKATVVLTSKSLLGQWEDEIRKHAPQLVVYRHHGNSKLRMADLERADVIVSCPTVEWSPAFRTNYRFHRVVLDESHLLNTSAASARLDVVLGLATDRSWCVTATPMVSSGRDLDKQIEFLCLEDEFQAGNKKELLQKHMLRHTKSQMINGAAALTLPESTTEVKVIPMTEWERKTFQKSREEKGRRIYRSNRQIRMVEMRWYYALMNPLTCEDSSKIVQLEKDLRSLLEREPNMRAVVFTQMKEQLRYARMAVQSMGLKVYSFSGSASAEYRDRLIREFQDVSSSVDGGSGGGGPAVFLITMHSGSVGITLTAASHVFLLEPCIDPAKEVQAAGRIHRLGQTKNVGVTKYVFEDSCDSNIHKLHEKIAAGSIQYMSGMLNSEAIYTLAGK